MSSTAYVATGAISGANPGLGPGTAGLEISWVVLADDGTVTGGPAGPFVMVNFAYGAAWADVAASVTAALQSDYGDPDLAVVFLPGTS